MSSDVRAIKPLVIAPGQVDDFAVDFTEVLGAFDADEKLTGTPTIDKVSINSSDVAKISISSTVVNTTQLTDDDGNTVAIGKAVKFRVTASNDAPEADYELAIRADSTVSGAKPRGDVRFQVRGNTVS